jgi:DNA-binding transcriptional ArsR family regulator
MSSDVFHAIADRNRRRLVDFLGKSELPVGDLVTELRMSYSAVSQHLAVLHRAGLVKRRAQGVRRLYRLNAEPLRAVYEWSAHYEKFWTTRMQRLHKYLDDK